jgi:hypothetical protein
MFAVLTAAPAQFAETRACGADRDVTEGGPEQAQKAVMDLLARSASQARRAARTCGGKVAAGELSGRETWNALRLFDLTRLLTLFPTIVRVLAALFPSVTAWVKTSAELRLESLALRQQFGIVRRLAEAAPRREGGPRLLV